MTTVDKILKDLDKVIASLDKPDFDILKVCLTIQKACKAIAAISDKRDQERAEIEKDISDMEETVDALIEENEILQVDIQIILEFLKKSGIDISYIVTKSDVAKKAKKK